MPDRRNDKPHPSYREQDMPCCANCIHGAEYHDCDWHCIRETPEAHLTHCPYVMEVGLCDAYAAWGVDPDA